MSIYWVIPMNRVLFYALEIKQRKKKSPAFMEFMGVYWNKDNEQVNKQEYNVPDGW